MVTEASEPNTLETLKNYLAQQNGKRSRNLSFNQIKGWKSERLHFLHTVRNLHFLSKNSTLISHEKIVDFWGLKNS